MNATSTLPPASSALTESLRDVFAEVTRYPLEILEADALLEEDLGIDSVKLGEVFSVLRERYSLPEDLGLEPEQLSTIAGISASLETFLAPQQGGAQGNGHAGNGHAANGHAGNGAAQAWAPVPTTAIQDAEVVSAPPAASGVPAAASGDLLTEVRSVFAEVTRYPADILEADALLEEDLGIDSVKLGEIFSVLRERYDLPEELGLEPEQLSTLSGITQALSGFIAPSAPAPAPAQTQAPVQAPAHVQTPAPIQAQTRSASALAASSFAALTPELKPFAGKRVLITGSGHGLGKDMAVYLAELGASVVINSFHSRDRGIATAEEIRDAGGEAHHIWGSVANNDQLQEMFDEVEQRYGGLDFFISNASNGMLARLEDITPHHWEKAFRTNIIGLHQGAMRAAALMRKNGGGKIITLSSPASQGYVDYFGCMGAVKAAVESLTRSLAIELAKDNIQVNCVSPGPVYGDLLDKWPDSERLIPQWEANTAYPRLCEARDVSHFVAYLLSDAVKLFTGSVLVLDGGISSQGW